MFHLWALTGHLGEPSQHLHSLVWLFIPQLLLLTLEHEPNPMPRPYKDDFWHRNISKLFLTGYRCKIFIVFLFWPYLLRMLLLHHSQLLTLQLDVLEEVFIIVCLSLLQVAAVTGFGLPYFSFFAFKLSGYTVFVHLDKNYFYKHKRNGSWKSECQNLIWDLDLIGLRFWAFYWTEMCCFVWQDAETPDFQEWCFSLDKTYNWLRWTLPGLGFLVEGGNILWPAGVILEGVLGWDPTGAPWVKVWGWGGGAVRLPAPSAHLPVCLSGGPVAMEKPWELSAWLAWLFS